ncbi:MAG: Glutamate-tRNA ligase [Candidatus Falkowbacteria bacterium GW2011_GWC2_38_22]|uniref:Glutamate--tRNA ligase n=1 Tax=Candidatus Falkowbacteria bacterium GW2011_GWE1_38_31 TaxID=1618638 RepID=A0A0G0MB57_9BACT|nr:MAG: Glutamate-tRNA ligase [Candidatus Falkowbacteria bacterium GW2011_GWF2_38_1205]KKQ62134.1 MAG: Glutamate-tRNA ligase [Candidatus Falkowbacteria bacterium GW2011_GWC2_38_22]KKQ64284.1 MAG: Glutamate-tRNA ligase [Candidatus Falkowbacteria bacterium GW2011_GWF1_38_22]KKQ66261.1 MAG: Glutamate-tRNA ligase [Candidatus Falkowbacteria bacterium GW2011_GWE2_38_254]KKQ70989.1 MAG: Glutamate-tRNA ligase [Candidatus Falkowbacteria bacterium GW2011_GWE1_38_31]KKQ73498.1 MAG: Glutamate-tRNA ligase 
MTKKIRGRLAPSPTGFLHIGNLRTALFGYLTIKSMGGDYILRIEDTDDKRFVPGAIEKLVDVLEWSGIKFDESPLLSGPYAPYVQSERKEIYKKHIDELLQKDGAYHCFCSSERLDKMREEQQANKKPPRYDRQCRNLNPEEVSKKIASGEPFVIRQKMPLDGEVKCFDELRGEITVNAQELDDHVLIKSNGMPTYQFANIVDDHLMEITHVTRGEEWIPSFPKNVLLYTAFGWDVPKFIHLPVVLNKEGGGKLSKRQGDVSVEEFREKGYLSDALINFIVLLGWHPEGDDEILSMEELIKKFDHKKISSSPAVFDVEKLNYFNGYYIRRMDLDKLTEMAMPYLKENVDKTSDTRKKSPDFIKQAVKIEQERLKKLSDIKEYTEFLFLDKLEYPKEMLIWKKQEAGDCKYNLITIRNILEKIASEEWTKENIENKILQYLNDNALKAGDFLWPTRVALTGKQQSPGPFDVAFVLGREESLEKIQIAIDALNVL